MFDREYRGYLIAVVAFIVLFLGMNLVRFGQQLAFERDLKAAKTRFTEVNKIFSTAESDLETAKSNHLSLYTKDLTLKDTKSTLTEAQNAISGVGKAKTFRAKHQVILFINDRLNGVSQKVGIYNNYFTSLDLAEEKHTTEIDTLGKAINNCNTYIASQVSAGFFDKHFAEAKILVQDGTKLRDKAALVDKKFIEKGLPDYVQVYQTCLEGERLIANALSSSQSIQVRKNNNDSRISALPGRIQSAQMRYAEARGAADWLQSYPRYRCLDEVVSAGVRISSVSSYLESARGQNTMTTQDFSSAAQNLATADNLLTGYQNVFNQAISTRQSVQSAIYHLSIARNEARSAIDRAQEEINSNTQNDQSDAESLLRDARNDYSTAKGMENSDPPRSIDKYNEAESGADSAYNAVDTSTRSTSSDDSYSTTPSTSPSSDGGLSGGGGGGFGGGGSPGGGGFGGGPSGGGVSTGPSGGGVGSGGF